MESITNTNNSVNIGKKFKIVSEQNTPGSHDFPVINTLGSLDSMVCWSNEIFKYTCSDACSKKVHQEVDSLVYSSQGSRDFLLYSLPFTRELSIPGVFITGESGLCGVFKIGESFLPILKSTQQSSWALSY